MADKIRTRFAPSPTGRMHVGNLRTALYAYLIAKHEGGDFLLRIEDTDQERLVEGAVDIIYRTMQATGLVHDEGPDKDGGVGPYVQSDRVKSGIYMEYAKKLIDKGEAYYCFCDKERLESLKQEVAGKEIMIYDKHCLHLSKEEVEEKLKAGVPYVIRQNNPQTGTTTFHDEIYGDITVDNSELDDMILIKSDGYPTYNFANVVDDHLMGITHVVRGNEYLSSSPKYNRLYEAFGWEVPVYVHCPLITDENHKKLSKRCGHSSYEDLIEQGFLTEAVVNFVALLGWSPEDNQEIMSLQELIEKFDVRPRGCAESPAGTLSGGNQQKVIIAREVTNDKELLIAVNPTRGLDVGAIEFVHKYLVEQRNKNRAVLLVSFELDEIMSLSDRIEVIFDGQITGSVAGKDADEKELGFMMAGGKTNE